VPEYTNPGSVAVDDTENLADMVWSNADRFGADTLLLRLVGDRWSPVTAAAFAADVGAAAKGLIGTGIRPGDRVGLLAATRYEWTVCDYAIWAAGAVTVPVYHTSSADQIRWILSDSGARAVIVDTDEHAATVRALSVDLADLTAVYELDDRGLDTLTEQGAGVGDADLLAARRSRGADDLATIVYTSGTTGRPKGCQLTHRNLLTMCRCIDDLTFVRPGASTLLFLPLAHVFARIVQCGTLYHRAVLAHCPDPKLLVPQLQQVRPTYLLAVPRVFEKIYNSARASATGVRAKIFAAAENTATEWSQQRGRTGKPGLGLGLRRWLFDRLVYRKILAAMGGRVEAAISGGAPLGSRLAHFFQGVGVTVYEGYGLTETTAGTVVNVPAAMKIGTVGRPMPAMSVRIADDGEIGFRGPLVFAGYWHNQEATAEVLDAEGWFATGDLGDLDADGFLSITGRKKELLVTAGGKNVAPAVLEDRLRAHPLISQCMVIGDGQPFIAVLITVDPDFFEPWKAANGKPVDATVAALADDPDLRAAVQEAVDDANTAVSHAESIREFVILPTDFTEEGGELSPSGKLRRRVVLEREATVVDRIYGGHRPLS
jgi:long-chain acyl-CoA synthetase